MSVHSCSLGMEARYLIDEATAHSLFNGMHRKWAPDSYSHFTLCELYLHADGHTPAPAETLRLRSYGIPGPEDCVYLERDMRWGDVSCTRRVALTLAEAERCISQNSQTKALRAPSALLGGNATPTLLLAYEQDAYVFSELGATLTLDSALRYRTEALHLQQGDWGERLLPEGYYMLHVSGELPTRLRALLGTLQLQNAAFSNYGYAYIAANLKERRGCV